MFLTLEQILAADDRKIITVACPEWGGDVAMMPFSGNDRDWYDQLQSSKRWPTDESGKEVPEQADWQGIRAAAVARAMCDEKGTRVKATEADVLALGERSGAALDRCYLALRKASGLGADEEEKAEKN